jgi:hypothetical protein
MIIQLNPAILVETPLGTGQALFVIDYGMHQNTCWVVALQKNGVVKHFDCNDIIIATNYTYGLNLMHNMNHPPDDMPQISADINPATVPKKNGMQV